MHKKNPKLIGLSNIQLMCESLEFGNLSTPFEFFKSDNQVIFDVNNSGENIKLSFFFDTSCITLSGFMRNILHKFEIEFKLIERLICVDEHQNTLIVYIPCKRPLLAYRANDEKLSIDSLKKTDERYLNWERVCNTNYDWSIKLKFSLKNKSELIKALQNICYNRILFCNVINSKIEYSISSFRADLKFQDFKLKYYLECLLSQYYSILNGKIDKKFSNLLNNLSLKQSEIQYLIEKLCRVLETNRFCSLEKSIKPILSEMIMFEKNSELETKNKPSDKNIMFVKHCIITPSRIIYYLPEQILSNRVLRQFGSENFLCVRIRDENLNKLNTSPVYSNMKVIYEKIKNILIDGINFYDKKFMFLAMSASQLRAHGCWLYMPNDSITTASKIREWMGDFKSIRCIAKYAARLGQSLSSSIETIHTNDFKLIEDLKVTNDDNRIEYCFTDGIGKISKMKAEEICNKHFDSKYISAFQIRFAGYKGVVAIDNNMRNDSCLEFRPSMKKYESELNKLDILNIADYIPCYLNRQVILILSSLGIDDSVFIDFQDIMLKQLNRILFDNNIASNFLLKYFKTNYSFGMGNLILNSTLNFTFEPFYRNLLKSIYNYQLHDLIKKSRIFIEKGRILMGTIDETGLLKEDQVFIQCSCNSTINNNFTFYEEIVESKRNGYFIVNSKVAIAKNPCMHPGDLRVLNAVYIPQLAHMTNCVVFPSKGKRPITNMCSGSDLDGNIIVKIN